MNTTQLINLLNELVKQPNESEWVEFKHNFHSPEEIGERISALSNSACLKNKPFGYLIFGIEDSTHEIVGTSYKAKSHKKGNEDFELWLCNRLNPRIDFEVIAPPTEYDTYFFSSLYKILLITTLKSKSPSGVKYPIVPEYKPRLVSSNSSIIFIAETFGAPVILPIGKVLCIISIGCVFSSTLETTVEIN